MRWGGFVVAALLLGATGCSYREAMADYCAETGRCECTDGDCCAIYGNRCGAISCCGDLVCSADGFCVRPEEPKLSVDGLSGGYFDLQPVDPGATTTRDLVLRNTGVGPTTQISVKYEGSGSIEVDGSACAGRVLAPQESCTIHLTGRPAAFGELTGSLEARELRAMATVPLRATGGTPVNVQTQWNSNLKVTSTPSGISCPGTCRAYFLSGTNVTLTSNAWAWGYHAVLAPSAGGGIACLNDSSSCEFVAAADRYSFTPYSRPNVELIVKGQGTVKPPPNPFNNSQPECKTTSADGFNYCPIPWVGSMTLTVTSGTVASWSACSGQGSTCTVFVSEKQLTPITVTFQ